MPKVSRYSWNIPDNQMFQMPDDMTDPPIFMYTLAVPVTFSGDDYKRKPQKDWTKPGGQLPSVL